MNPGFNQLQVELDQVEASGSFDPKSIHLPGGCGVAGPHLWHMQRSATRQQQEHQ